MTKSTTKSNENENYYGYILFSALVLICTLNSGNIYQWFTSDNHNDTPTQIQVQNQTSNTSNKLATGTINYCALSSLEIQKELTNERHYTLNGYGYVNFTQRFDRGRNQWVENQIMISGNGKRLTGNWRLLSNNRISITNLIATGGNYDASNNSKTRGMLIIDCNGNLKGTLADRNGNTRDILIQKSR